jgi:hypothetical protein
MDLSLPMVTGMTVSGNRIAFLSVSIGKTGGISVSLRLCILSIFITGIMFTSGEFAEKMLSNISFMCQNVSIKAKYNRFRTISSATLILVNHYAKLKNEKKHITF